MTGRVGKLRQHGRVRLGAIAAFAVASLAAGALLAHQGFAIGGATPTVNTGALTNGLQTGTAAQGSSSASSANTSSSGTSSGSGTSGMPADKATVTGSQMAAVSPFSDQKLLSVSLRTSTPEDLLLSVTLECSILTQVSTTGSATSDASGKIDVWITVDSNTNVVPVVPTDPHDSAHGQVTFCNRHATQTVADGDSSQAGSDTITEYLKTKTANGFNWANLDTGNGIHTVTVWATFYPGSSCTDAAPTSSTTTNCTGEVGNRTLTIQPTKFAN